MLKRLVLVWLMIAFSSAATAQAPDDAFRARTDQLVAMLKQPSDAMINAVFASAFIAQIPSSHIVQLSEQLRSAHGRVLRIDRIVTNSPTSGVVDIGYERATVRFNLEIASDLPHAIIGLQVASVMQRGDTSEKLSADLRALPGDAALLVRRLDNAAPALVDVNSRKSLAVGSVFKLWVLAEASRQVGAGKRKWSDVVPLGEASLPSGMTQNWPRGAPMTLHSLATLMISISDNSASDTVLRQLGRGNVDTLVLKSRLADAPRTLPVLTTVEAFALKMNAAADLRLLWSTSPVPARRALLDRSRNRLTLGAIDRTQLAGAPRYIESIEWFASPEQMASTMDLFRSEGSREAFDILAINSGLPPGDAARFAYVGYKGGSEIGVIAMTYLIRTKAGTWYAVSGAWNNRADPVDGNRFEALMTRAVALIE
jgi:beta-lactamase class A